MNGVLGQNSALRPGKTCANEMNFGMKHAPGAGSITQPVDLQSSVIPLDYDLHTPPPPQNTHTVLKIK